VTATPPTQPIPVALFGATGAVGQRFAVLLSQHPWFELVRLCASERSVGKPYAEAARWILAEPMPPELRERIVEPCVPRVDPAECPIVFSALDTESALAFERDLARLMGVKQFFFDLKNWRRVGPGEWSPVELDRSRPAPAQVECAEEPEAVVAGAEPEPYLRTVLAV